MTSNIECLQSSVDAKLVRWFRQHPKDCRAPAEYRRQTCQPSRWNPQQVEGRRRERGERREEGGEREEGVREEGGGGGERGGERGGGGAGTGKGQGRGTGDKRREEEGSGRCV